MAPALARAVSAPMLALLVATAWQPLPRTLAHAAPGLSLTALATVTWRASCREARVGHRLVATALLLHPLMLVALVARGGWTSTTCATGPWRR